MLTAILMTFLVVALVTLIALGVTAGLLVRSIVVRNRLHPSIETGAPLTWYWSPAPAAQLHRRLQRALAPIVPARRGRRRPLDSHAELVAVITEQATAVDHELIEAARLRGVPRRVRLRELRRDVRQIESASLRLLEQRRLAAAAAGTAPREEVLADVHARLDLLAAAHSELTAIEQATTASDPDELLRRLAETNRAEPVTRPVVPGSVPTRPPR